VNEGLSLLRAFLAMIALCVTGVSAQSRSLHIAGTAGYLSEWEFDGEVRERVSGDSKELFGRLIWKHVGVCSVNGPQEKEGEIRMRLFSKSGQSSQLSATISFDGGQCVYTGDFSGVSNGYMDCPHSKGVPLSISVK
jgi:hypothetical protein